MTITEPIHKVGGELLDSLRLAVDNFRNCEDRAGLDYLLEGLDALEDVMALCQCLGEPALPPKKLIPALQQLYRYLQNQDITGLTDFLEFQVCPALESWIRGEKKC